LKIKHIAIRRFRSLLKADLQECAGLNVLIGKNNSGKSSILSAIEICFAHLGDARIAAPLYLRRRALDEFTDRKTDEPIQIGMTIEIDESFNLALRDIMKQEAVGLEHSVEQIATNKTISLVIAVALDSNNPFRYLHQVGIGELNESSGSLRIKGPRLFEASLAVARELFGWEKQIDELKKDLEEIDNAKARLPSTEYLFRDKDTLGAHLRYLRESTPPKVVRIVEAAAKASSNAEQFNQELVRAKSEIGSRIDTIRETATSEPMNAFAGAVRRPPAYIIWLMKELGRATVLHFKETRRSIGREEASQLLQLKTKRGGTERLNTLQRAVRALLGVTIDAFEPDDSPRSTTRVGLRPAEMDIDNFLVEANGAGVREALRIILDLELNRPDFVLIEEPEVHLHPGLEKVIHAYLVEKSKLSQIFVATHSTNFLDTSASQNIFILSRNAEGHSSVERVSSEDDILRVPDEVGLTPSSVLMFDRLVFVEGPSDEDILREFARKLDIDLAGKNISFVQMGGATRFAHYAAEATIGILSKRRIPMWFIVDRDEKDGDDIRRLVERLGNRAHLLTFRRREIENYLLNPAAILRLVNRKKLKAVASTGIMSPETIADDIHNISEGLQERVMELRLMRKLCRPIHIDRGEGDVRRRLEAARQEIESRLSDFDREERKQREDLGRDWSARAMEIVPGSLVLDGVLAKYGSSYNKQVDGLRLAEFIDREYIDEEIVRMLKKISLP